jgi:soluble P-type ATPase
MHIDIPGYRTYDLHHLVLDFNGTLARDGVPLRYTYELLKILSEKLTIHVVTADTFGSVTEALNEFPCTITILSEFDQHLQKKAYAEKLGAQQVIAIGNGRNDREMLKIAALSIGVVNEEGAAKEVLQNVDILCRSIIDALELFIYPKRLVATLRT